VSQASAAIQVEGWSVPGLRLASTPDVVDAFRELYAVEYPKIAGYCFLLVRDRDLAHDLAQEAFTRLFARWRSVREPRPFLFRVATNLAHDSWRQRTRERAVVDALRPSAADVVADAGRRIDLYEAVLSLRQAHRDVVLLHYYADLAVADVAVALHRPLGTVKRLLSEARTQLALALEDSRA
jgi:RNA polymerase sigma-70 factor (ECF subfamily)